MKAIRFTRDTRPWRAGDVIPLPCDIIGRLVSEGSGVAVDAPDNPYSVADAIAVDPPAPPARYLTKDKRRG